MTADSSPDVSLKKQLEAVCKDLWWSSESDYPVEAVWYSVSNLSEQETPTLLHKVIEVDSDKSLQVVDNVEGFFARSLTPKSWHTAEDKAQLTQLQQLKTLLSESLTQLKVYRYGEIEVLIYILGRTSEGDIAGIRTCSVET